MMLMFTVDDYIRSQMLVFEHFFDFIIHCTSPPRCHSSIMTRCLIENNKKTLLYACTKILVIEVYINNKCCIS